MFRKWVRGRVSSEGEPERSAQPHGPLYVEYDLEPFAGQFSPLELFAFYAPTSTTPETIGRDIELARHYGLRGFVVEHGGDSRSATIVEPLSKARDFQFCLSLRLIHDTPVAALADTLEAPAGSERYKKVGGKALVILESSLELAELRPVVEELRKQVKDGLGKDLYLILGALNECSEDPRPFGFDGVSQLNPQVVTDTPHPARRVFSPVNGDYSYTSVRRAMLFRSEKPYPDFQTVYAGPGEHYGFFTHMLYRGWLERAIWPRTVNGEELPEPLAFIKSWNDADHGLSLLPDEKYGYKLLAMTKAALELNESIAKEGKRVVDPAGSPFDPSSYSGVPEKPVIVFQMGKVGSTTVANALRTVDIPGPIVHTHALNRLEEEIELALRNNYNPDHTVHYLHEVRRMRAWMGRAGPDTVFNMITLVRDPVARNFSSLFELIDVFIPDYAERVEKGDLDVLELQDYFLATHITRLCDWFSGEFEPVIPFKIGDLPYEHGMGYVIAENLPYRLIVFRNEDLDKVVVRGLTEFLGVAGIELRKDNITAEKSVGELYRQFRSLPWPAEFIDYMYDDPIVRRFYSDGELASLRAKYLRGAS